MDAPRVRILRAGEVGRGVGKSSHRRKGKTVTARKCFGTSGHKQRERQRESYLHDEGDTSGLNGAGDFPRCGGRDVLQLSTAVWRGYASPGVSIRSYGVVFGGAEHVKLSLLKPIKHSNNNNKRRTPAWATISFYFLSVFHFFHFCPRP